MEIKADIVSTLKIASRIIEMAEERASALIHATDAKTKWNVDYSVIDEAGITVYFIEDTRHDCPETTGLRMGMTDLTSTDEMWAKHVLGEKEDRERKEAEKKLAQEEQERKSKEETFERLKRELNK